MYRQHIYLYIFLHDLNLFFKFKAREVDFRSKINKKNTLYYIIAHLTNILLLCHLINQSVLVSDNYLKID